MQAKYYSEMLTVGHGLRALEMLLDCGRKTLSQGRRGAEGGGADVSPAVSFTSSREKSGEWSMPSSNRLRAQSCRGPLILPLHARKKAMLSELCIITKLNKYYFGFRAQNEQKNHNRPTLGQSQTTKQCL